MSISLKTEILANQEGEWVLYPQHIKGALSNSELSCHRFGFITFDDVDTATKVLDGMDGTVVDGYNIELRYAEDKGRGGGRRGVLLWLHVM